MSKVTLTSSATNVAAAFELTYEYERGLFRVASHCYYYDGRFDMTIVIKIREAQIAFVVI